MNQANPSLLKDTAHTSDASLNQKRSPWQGLRSRLQRLAGIATVACSLVLGLPAKGVTINGGIWLLTSAGGTQLETWLGEGPLALTSIFSRQVGDGKTSLDFHAAVDGQGRTFVILEVLSVGGQPVNEIIGGYNPQSWRSSPVSFNQTPNIADRTAAIFNLTDSVWRPQSLSVAGTFQTLNGSAFGPVFGGGYDIYVDSTLSAGSVNRASYGVSGGPNILGGLTAQNVGFGRMEVFTLAPESNPVLDGGSALALLGCALAGIGLVPELTSTGGNRGHGEKKFADPTSRIRTLEGMSTPRIREVRLNRCLNRISPGSSSAILCPSVTSVASCSDKFCFRVQSNSN